MKLLLTSSGITNSSLRAALVDLLGKPVEESTALVVPTGMHPFSVGQVTGRLLRGEVGASLTGLGWAELGLLELTALPSIGRDVWVKALEETDALLVWGGDPVYVAHWLRVSGVADVLPSLDLVYVGVSAGAMAVAPVLAETFVGVRDAAGGELSSEPFVLASGEAFTLVTASGSGLAEVAVIPHYTNPNHSSASEADAPAWAARIPGPAYALDDQSGLRVVDGAVEVVSEGIWRLFEP